MAISLKCQSCGKQVRAKDTSAGKRVKCPGCGTVLHVPDTEVYAAEVDEPTTRQPAPAKGAKSGGSKGWVAGLVGLAGTLLAAGGFFWWMGREAPVPDERPIAQTAEPPTPVAAPSPLPPDAVRPPEQAAVPDVPAPEKDKAAIALLDPTEVITRIAVTIHIGAGADLEEPVALDLGLGYPLWLHPVGHKPGEPPPRGAIPEETTAKDNVAAGESALFTFTAKGDAGQDQFRTSEHLLANTRVGDIVRVGFACTGTTNWMLAGYEIAINDKPFAAGTPNAKAGDRDTGNKRLAELAGQIGPLEQVQSDMQQLLLANQLEEEDKTQLKDVLTKLAPLAREKNWLAGQLEGKYPWFEDKEFKSPADGKPVVNSAKVTLLTVTDKRADTANYVYARIGGRKYFISSPDQPLTGQAGPQVFDLDLMAGPLTDADLRDWALGMLGNAKPYDGAPDRWHGQRVQIEIDGKVRYDSENSDPDRASLLAVRLIPPAHLDKAGSLVIDKEIDRLVFLWDPTAGSGLDPATKTPLPPLTPDSPQSPPPENPDPPQPQPDSPQSPPPDQPAPGSDQPQVAQRTPDLPDRPPPGVPQPDAPVDRLAGELPLPPFFPPVSQPVFFPVPVPTVGFTITDFLNAMAQFLGIPLPPSPTPVPSGNPPAVFDPRFISGAKLDGLFTVGWQMKGDVSQVASYQVELLEISPDQPQAIGRTFQMPMPMPGGDQRSFSGQPVGLATASPPPRFLVAKVTAVPNVGPILLNLDTSAARMVFPSNTDLNPGGQPVPETFDLVRGSTTTPSQGIGFAEDPSTTLPSVWSVGEFHYRGIRFEAAAQGVNLGMRPAILGDKLRVHMSYPNPGLAHNLVADLGFRGTGTGTVTATIIQMDWFDKGGSFFVGHLPLPTAPTLTTSLTAGQTATPFLIPVDPTQSLPVPPGPLFSTDQLKIIMEFSFTGINTAEPPVLFGVRMIP